MQHSFVNAVIRRSKLTKHEPLFFETVTKIFPPLKFAPKAKLSKIQVREDRIREQFYRDYKLELMKEYQPFAISFVIKQHKKYVKSGEKWSIAYAMACKDFEQIQSNIEPEREADMAQLETEKKVMHQHLLNQQGNGAE